MFVHFTTLSLNVNRSFQLKLHDYIKVANSKEHKQFAYFYCHNIRSKGTGKGTGRDGTAGASAHCLDHSNLAAHYNYQSRMIEHC